MFVILLNERKTETMGINNLFRRMTISGTNVDKNSQVQEVEGGNFGDNLSVVIFMFVYYLG